VSRFELAVKGNFSLVLFFMHLQSSHDAQGVVPLEKAYDGTVEGFTDDDGMGPVLPPTGIIFCLS
jgi:hypothetical protein